MYATGLCLQKNTLDTEVVGNSLCTLHCRTAFSALMLLVSRQEIKTLHQYYLVMVVEFSGWVATVCSTLWQPHLPISTTESQLAYPGSPGKWPLKWGVCVCALHCRHLARAVRVQLIMTEL